MAVVGLALASAHLSALARWLRTRLRVGFFIGALSLILVGQILWIWHWGVRPDYDSAAEWNQAMQCWLLGVIILAVGLIAITLWAMPSSAGQRREGDDRFRFA
jgi:tellurite resistance protein TehA-like permease